MFFCRFLGFNTFTAYQRARFSAVKILGRHFIAAAEEDQQEGVVGGRVDAPADVPTVATITGGQVTLDITTPTL